VDAGNGENFGQILKLETAGAANTDHEKGDGFYFCLCLLSSDRIC
jgi:hypothetical protein